MEYKSLNTGEICKPAHLIAEIMVQRKFKGKVLPLKFWNDVKYKKEYKQQIVAANSILKVYSPQAILAALSHRDLEWCYSLRYEKLHDRINAEQTKINEEQRRIEESKKIDTSDPSEYRTIQTGQKSLKSKLD